MFEIMWMIFENSFFFCYSIPGHIDWKTEQVKAKSGIIIYLTGTPKNAE